MRSAALLVLSTLVALLAAEAVLRQTDLLEFPPAMTKGHPRRGYTLRPGFSGESAYGVPLRIDALGFRGPEVAVPKPAGLRRVLADFGLEGAEVVYVGDNLAKDMPLAEACGAVGVTVKSPRDLDSGRRGALLGLRRPVLLDVHIDPTEHLSIHTRLASLKHFAAGGAR
jgi:hypothetical protein